MPKVKAKVLKTGNKDGRLLCLIEVDQKQPAPGEVVSVKWGSVRTLPQNAIYWAFLNWCITVGGLSDHGHFFAESLHDNLKKHLLGSGVKDSELLTTTDLTKSEFSEYFERVDKFMQEFFEIDTSAFWKEHGEKVA